MAKAGKQSEDQGLSFEEAMEKLESVVESMESDDLPLEKLLTQYEAGTKLVAKCQEKLSAAELRIRKLEKLNAED
ncbi:MAG: exodeoxyribonuclease VII small subunit [Verrucomicrobiales bacterium]|nr:exodeoxyribonuclease VII small subunit [Verrucomicrobiales bacterium]|tara:strand:- start:720 stop:944 length:225 start_codon:yes stop_codon:yes gene_type:complete